MRTLFALFICVVLASGGAESASLNVTGPANPPVGYPDFCKHFEAECVAQGSQEPMILTEARWRELQQMNRRANRIISPETDLDCFDREELWTLPKTCGDCEDSALLKRKWLVERGWPTGALLVSYVLDENGDGHAVLLARTSRGDFVLDNKSDKIKKWYDSVHYFLRRQSVSDPNRWVSLNDPRPYKKNTTHQTASTN